MFYCISNGEVVLVSELTLAGWGNWTTPSAGPRTYFQKTFWLDDVKVLEMRMKPHQVAAKVLKAEVLQAEKDIKKIEEFEAKS